MELAILYNLAGTEKGKRIKRLLFRLGIGILEAKAEDYTKSIGSLIGSPICRENREDLGKTFEDEMMVFCGLSEKNLDAVLTEMRKERLAVSLKAVATEHNLSWSSMQLHDELVREHEYMKRSFGQGTMHHGK